MPNQEFHAWMKKCRDSVKVEVTAVTFPELNKWLFEPNTGNLVHESGRFFSIEGIRIKTNWGRVANWTQPIINQPEIGFLGIITKKFNGVLYFLMQAKIEPGNINYVQLSPTLQATKSNYSKVHKGNTPNYLEYFNGDKPRKVLMDQLQSEQGARFLRKRNRNIIVEVDDDIEVKDDFCWLTLGQIKTLMRFDNLINMDTRTVISGINFGSYPSSSIDVFHHFAYQNGSKASNGQAMLLSALDELHSHQSMENIISWITGLKSTYELEVDKIPLNQVAKWIVNDREIFHEQHKYFSVIAANVHISNREVSSWFQPLVRSAQEGLIAFIVKDINGVMHFLVQAKIEAGNFDILELAPTVQCLTGNYRSGLNEYEVPFIKEVLETSPEKILFRSMQSEEGGRFFREQNLNMIVEAPDSFPEEVPENFCWMTLNQLSTFIRYNNYLNIQARSLLAAVIF
ncbi:MAG: NDP-hexose 2,3-dehydratase family protein [Chitinophagaceae bacterium]|nr:NDP-hexose 2,3-dehydratase family protein [Chitinophagaceae bacterium]